MTNPSGNHDDDSSKRKSLSGPLAPMPLAYVHTGHFSSADVSFRKQGRHHNSFFRFGGDKPNFVFDCRLIPQTQGFASLRSNG